MNIQTNDGTGTSLYELVFGLKPQTVLFPSGKCSQPILDIERDGIQKENNKHTIEMDKEYHKWKAEEEMVTEDVQDKEMAIERVEIGDEGWKE